MKTEWKKITEEEMSEDLMNKILLQAEPLLEGRIQENEKSFLSFLFTPMVGLTAAAALGLILVVTMIPKRTELNDDQLSIALANPAMLNDLDLFLNMQVIQKIPVSNRLEKKKWLKKSS